MDEKGLVRRCRAGEPGARQEMYETYAGRVLAVCRRYIRDADRARDLVHDTFLKAWESLDRFRPRRAGSLGAWLCQIAVHLTVDELRRGRHFLEIPDQVRDDGEGVRHGAHEPGPEEPPVDPDRLRQIPVEELIELIHELNERRDVHGILCQLPVPKHIDDKAVIAAIDPKKDVDAFSEINVGKILIGKYDLLPCTPAGVMELLDYYDIKVEGRNCVVIGRSNIVGKPMAVLLMHANGTVTVTHKKTRHLREVTNKADILVSSVGRAKFVTADMVKEGAVVVDVGMNRDENGKLCGDVVFDEVAPKCSYITPVPGGVGPMTIAMLMQNTLKAFEIQQSGYEG